MRFLAALFFLFSSSCFAVTAAQYSVQASAGASYDAMMGIIMSNVAPKFSATAAGDAVQAVKSAPLSISTPYGPAAGTLTTSGLLSKPAVAALGKALARASPYVMAGTALYDIYTLAGMVMDSSGNVMYVPPPSQVVYTSPACAAQAQSIYGGQSFWVGTSLVPYGGASQVLANGQCLAGWPDATWHGVGWGFTAVPPAPAPATQAQKDAAIDAGIAADINAAARLAADAWKAGEIFPAMSVIQSVPKQSFQTNWYQTAAYLDVLNNATVTEAQAVISFDPAASATVNDPIPMTVVENKRTTTNGTQTGSSSSPVVSQAPGNTTASGPNSPLQPQNQTDCDKNPNSIGCSAFGESDVPDSPLGTLSQSVSFTPVNLGGGGSCPAPRTFHAAGTSFSMSYDRICTFQSQSKPLVLAACALIGAFIFVGGMKIG